MRTVVSVTVHQSQFPATVRRVLVECLRRREVNPKFLYESVRQSQKWLALHEAYSPARTDSDCQKTYDLSFENTVARLSSRKVHLVGLGCGGGQKDARFLELLQSSGREVFYTPADVSLTLVLMAREATSKIVPEQNCFPLVCDLALAEDLPQILECQATPEAVRVCTFFGMIPNFEPQIILTRLVGLLRPADWLLFSANLSPGPDYHAGVERILPLYDNPLTRDWLLTFLSDLGLEKTVGNMVFRIEQGSEGLKRIAADFVFCLSAEISLDDHRFEFKPGDSIRVFYSYRHTPMVIRNLLACHGLEVVEDWSTKSEEEGVFLCRRR